MNAAFWLTLLGPQHLLPEVGGQLGIQQGDAPAFPGLPDATAATWSLYCPPGNLDPYCKSDADLDGAPDSGDCEWLDAGRYPEFEDPPFSSTFDILDPDRNCDGWPNVVAFPPVP